MRNLQEKFQISVPTRQEAGEGWATAESARDINGEPGWRGSRADECDYRRFNCMPPGMEIDNQYHSEINAMPMSLAGETDVSADTNPGALDRGFTKRQMKGTDDQYTGEHMDLFYGDAGGFIERNNYLDRE